MKLSDIIKNIPHINESDMEIDRIEYDSRKACENTLFVCLPGAKRDGHDFAMGTYQNGTRAFLVERELPLPEDCVQIITPDTRAALAIIAADFYGRPADKLHIIGITGTKGKTTTALLVSAILNAAGKNCAYIGSNGVIINGQHLETVNTTPESLQLHHFFAMMVAEKVEYAVLEVSSQALVHNRVDGVPFEVTAFTNLYPDHISDVEHANMDEYRDAKKLLFDRFFAKCVVYNADDPVSKYMISGHTGKTYSYSMEKSADMVAGPPSLYRNETSLGITFDCTESGGTLPVSLMTPGAFSVYNGLCAMAICRQFGVDRAFAAQVLSRTPVQGRFEIVEAIPGITFVIDYSHNGISLTKALQTLREYDPERIICVFGSVGSKSECRRQELAEAASAYADYSIITSDNPDYEDPDKIIDEIAYHMGESPYECIADRALAIEKAVQIARKGDIVLLAGKGHEDYQLVYGRKVHFCEREILEEACAALTVN